MSPLVRAWVAALVLAVLAAASPAVTSVRADLGSRIGASRGKDRALQSAIGADSRAIAGNQVRLADLRQRLSGLQRSLDVEQAQLSSLQQRLRDARAQLVALRLAYVRDRRTLARQLVGQYELPHPNLVSVVLSSQGFSDLLETATRLHSVADHNASVTARVTHDKVAVGHQARQLTVLAAQQERVTAAALTQRDQVDAIKQQLIARDVGVQQSRTRKRAQLATLRRHRKLLVKKLADLQAQAAGFAGAGPGLPTGGAPAFGDHGGAYGFFPAPGTNYSVGAEPTLAARLDVLGKALHLHLIGISGYRSPVHSVEVGGYADDPHTHGLASDTPGVEGVPEATLNHYGLTRPFPGPAEADHIQLT